MATNDATILIVDDNKKTRQITRHIIKNMNYGNILLADNGRDAFNFLLEEKINLVISEWDLPVVNGLMLLKKIRQTDKISSIPFIMLVTLHSPAMIKQASDAKVTELIIKPFTAGGLEEKVSGILT